MHKIWLVANHYFRQEASKKSFVLLLFLMPLILVFTVGMGFLFAQLDRESTRLGYVDQAGLVADTDVAVDSQHEVTLAPFASQDEARAALEEGQIDAYYVIAADYATSRRADVIYFESPHWSAWRYFADVVRANLLADQPPALIERLLQGAEVTVRSSESGRVFPAGGPSVGHFVPLIIAMMFAFLTMTTAGFMMEVMAAEKENRTIEIVISSISPGQLMAGKIGGAIGLTSVQLLVWVAFLIGTIWLGAGPLDIDWLQDLAIDWRPVYEIVIVAVPAFLFIGALMTTIGSTLVETQEAQQAGPFFFFLVFLPVYLIIPIASSGSENSPLVLVFSLFPPTSVMTIALRSTFAQVPTWQIATTAAIGLVGGGALVWLAGRAFRLGLLRYGQRLRLREILTRHPALEPDAPAQAEQPRRSH